MQYLQLMLSFFFFFNDTATTEIYTLSLHDALPISVPHLSQSVVDTAVETIVKPVLKGMIDRKSTRLNSSHANISYAVFCLKKKKQIITHLNSIHANYTYAFLCLILINNSGLIGRSI